MKNHSTPAGKTLIFLHIHKTAGSSLSTILERQFPAKAVFPGSLTVHPNWRTMRILWGKRFHPRQIMAEFERLSAQQRRRIRYLHHHIPFGIHNRLEQPSAYVTMLRHPVSRVTSMYYYMRRSTHIAHLNRPVQQMTLADFVKSDVDDDFIAYGNNAQVYRISGMKKGAHEPQLVLDTAKRNLSRYFDCFGFCERFNESLLLMARNFGWKWRNLLNFKRQVAQDIPQKTLTPSVQTLIEEHNRLDMDFYAYAQKLFDDALARQGRSFHRELRQFEAQLADYRAKPRIVAYNKLLNSAVAANIRLRTKLNRLSQIRR